VKKLIVFDLDGTLAESKSPLDGEMARILGELLAVVKVAIISGGDWPQFETQLISSLTAGANLKSLSLLPTCGTKFYRFQSSWVKIYSEDFKDEEKKSIVASFRTATEALDVGISQVWGEQIEDRGSQITYSALGQRAPLEQKKKWDPDFSKRQRIKAVLDTLIPQFSVRIGGTTSVDVTKLGIDKAYGLRKLRDELGIALKEMLFIGDALFPGGNDYPARETGVDCIQVRDSNETKRINEAIIACLEGVDGHDVGGAFDG
jgi:phosphomannomutase